MDTPVQPGKQGDLGGPKEPLSEQETPSTPESSDLDLAALLKEAEKGSSAPEQDLAAILGEAEKAQTASEADLATLLSEAEKERSSAPEPDLATILSDAEKTQILPKAEVLISPSSDIPTNDLIQSEENQAGAVSSGSPVDSSPGVPSEPSIEDILKQVGEEIKEDVVQKPLDEMVPSKSQEPSIEEILKQVESDKKKETSAETSIEDILKQVEQESKEIPVSSDEKVSPITPQEIPLSGEGDTTLPIVPLENEILPAPGDPSVLESTSHKMISSSQDKERPDFDVSRDPGVIDLKTRMKEKSTEVTADFLCYKTFSVSFIRRIPQILKRRKKVRSALREYSEWVEKERLRIHKIEDLHQRVTLEKASVILDQEGHWIASKGKQWIYEGRRKALLIILWFVSVVLGLGFGIPSLTKIYFRKMLKPAVVQEVPISETVEVEPAEKKSNVPKAFLLLSCESSQVGVLGALRVFDREGKQVASFPHVINHLKKKKLVEVPSGELAIKIETSDYPIIGMIEMTPGKRRFIDVSRWTDPAARAILNIQTSPDDVAIICNGVPLGRGYSRVYLISGSHRVWASIPNFPPQEVGVIIADDQEQSVTVTISMGRFIFHIPQEISRSNRNIRVFVDSVLVTNLQSYPVLSGHHIVKIMESGRVILEQQVELNAAEEVVFAVQRLDDGQLSASLISKKSAIR